MKTVGVILLGGSGTRLNTDLPKQFLQVKDKMICEYAIEVFEQSDEIDEICVVGVNGYEDIYKKLENKYDKIKHFVYGGTERQYSVYNAIKAVSADVLVIHDGARPFVTSQEISGVKEAALQNGGAITALPVKDTIKVANNSIVEKTLNRNELWAVKTPQAFRYDLLLKAHNEALKQEILGTDDAQLIENMGEKIFIVNANDNNIKITTKIDLITMKAILDGEVW